ncbi:MAG: hypothetical protein NTW21_17000 [Verrucomicrobia bacterium]|nr:hypothetical protein [Verrucomicrobiota bacterium]
MKPIRFSNLLGQSRTLRSFRLALATPALVLTLTTAHAGTPASTPAPAEPAAPASNWIGFTIGGAFINGNDAGMMRRTQTNGDFYGGIDSFQFAKALDKDTTLTIDGHVLPGLEDYEGNLNITKNNLGYLKAGYKQYRTWYDGSGGYMPQLAQLYAEPAWGDELSVDRGEFSFEAGLRMENLPEITFAYNHAYRDGQKDSTSWGDRPTTWAGSTTPFKFAPALWNLDESTDTFGLDIEHTLGNTDLGMGLTYEHTKYTNSLSYRTGSFNSSTNANNRLDTTKTDQYTMDLFAGNVHSVTRFNDKLWLTAGFAYTTVDTDTDGYSRSIVNAPGNVGTSGSFATSPTGGGQFEQCVGNINLMWTPIADLTITPSLRIEQSSQSAIGVVDNHNAAGVTTAGSAILADIGTNATTGALDLRYTGISDLVLYAKGQWGYEEQRKWYQDVYTPNASQPPVPAGAPSDWLRDEIQTNEQEYIVGANWYPLSGLSFSLQGFYSERNNSYDPTAGNGPGGSATLRPAMLDFDTTVDDVNLRMTWRPMSNLSLVTRYDYRETEYSNRGVRWTPTDIPGGPPGSTILNEVDSSNITAHILSESVTWSPLARLYVQGNLSYTWAQTDTNSQWAPDSDNDYVSGSLTCGYAIDDRTDITASYTYYGASNYAQQGYPYTAVSPNGIPYAMGYGLETQEHAVSLTLTRALTPNMVWNLRYAVMTSQTDSQDQSGGFNDFTAQMVSTGLQIRF